MLGSTARHALIPMVGGVGAVCRVVCDGQLPPEHPAQLDRRVSALLECGLYAAGQQALAAVHALHLPKSGWLPPPPAALTVLNPGDVGGLSPENARSAEFGLALAWLLERCAGKANSVIATGLLDSASADGVAVLPVFHLAEKLRLLIEHFERPAASSAPSVFFIPDRDPDGMETTARYASELQRLHALGVQVHAVGQLSQACAVLGLRRLARAPRERQFRLGVSWLVVLLAVFVTLMWWLGRPLVLGFAAAASPGGVIYPTPARARLNADGALSLLPSCEMTGSDASARYPEGERLAVKLAPVADVVPVYGIVVTFSGSSGVQVHRMPSERLDGQAGVAFSIDIQPPPEMQLLVVLAQRLRAFDATALQSRLQNRLVSMPMEERLNAARNWLGTQGAGRIEHLFSVVGKDACE